MDRIKNTGQCLETRECTCELCTPTTKDKDGRPIEEKNFVSFITMILKKDDEEWKELLKSIDQNSKNDLT